MNKETTLNYQYRADYHQSLANDWRARRLAEEGAHGHTALAKTYLEYELHEAHLASVERFAGKHFGQIADNPPEGVANAPGINESQAEIKHETHATPETPPLTAALSEDTPPDVIGPRAVREAFRRGWESANPHGIVGSPAHTDDLARDLPPFPILPRALHDVREERRRQYQLGYTATHDDDHDALTWLALLLQRTTVVAEMLSDMSETTDPSDRRHTARNYLVQAAAVAVAWIEALDRQEAGDGAA